ncbi:P-type conjugative transfer protein TrbL [Caulobacter sp. S45]|uniref:P-type conjugative transfer protein TrbL n=1 Tax=Caulobacter sp. S45 TaxID=1641861 RepID=UPI00131D4668|nr:P-type conjugative transfer protein TrbL [Caulobacter sp. S45]
MTGGTGVVDGFTNTFSTYIDSGFGLVHGDVSFVASTLIAIDITLAGLFWAWGADEDILARLVKKTLYVGFFAFLISNFNSLAGIVFNSFAGLGLEAAGSTVSASDFVHPGRIAQVGLDAGKPILTVAGQLTTFTAFFDNFILIFVLMIAWLIVLLSFFVMAIQLFVTLIEFKLTTLAGFVLVPFGLFNKTAFLAEKVLGNVVASGVKVLVLAVIVGIGTTLFSQFTTGFPANPNIEDALSIALASLTLLGLSIFGPGIATGLVSGAPQLGAGAAIGTGLAAGGLALAGGMAAAGAVGAGAGVLAAAKGGSAGAGGAGAAGAAGGARSMPPGGPSGGAPAGGGAAAKPASAGSASGPAGGAAGGGSGPTGGSPASADAEQPDWAKRMRRGQAVKEGAATAAHVAQSGDRGGGAAAVDLEED